MWQVMLELLADTELDPRPEPYKTKLLEKKSEAMATNNEATCSWATPVSLVCTDTLRLIEHSLQWSPYDLEAHHLFPPAFQGVRHVLELMVALERVGRGLPQPIWMLIIASLPRA